RYSGGVADIGGLPQPAPGVGGSCVAHAYWGGLDPGFSRPVVSACAAPGLCVSRLPRHCGRYLSYSVRCAIYPVVEDSWDYSLAHGNGDAIVHDLCHGVPGLAAGVGSVKHLSAADCAAAGIQLAYATAV